MEDFDKEVDLATYFGQDPQERIESLTKKNCEDCGHAISAHGKHGCEIERGDVWIEGTNCGGLVASGPCGCQAYEAIKEGSRLTNDLGTVAEARKGFTYPLTYPPCSNLAVSEGLQKALDARSDRAMRAACTPNDDPLQVALALYAREIARTGKVMHSLGRKCDAD